MGNNPFQLWFWALGWKSQGYGLLSGCSYTVRQQVELSCPRWLLLFIYLVLQAFGCVWY